MTRAPDREAYNDCDEIVLNANSLLGKWGFDDGNLLDDILFAEGFANVPKRIVTEEGVPDLRESFGHAVLEEVVRIHLGPLVNLELRGRANQSHNPIRAVVPEGYDVAALSGVSATISRVEIIRIANEVAKGFDVQTPSPSP